MSPVSQGPTLGMLQHYLFNLLKRKLSWIALGWAVVYLCTQWMNTGIPTLFAPMVGGLGGTIIGWVVGENAVEEAGFSGLALWVILVLSCWLTIWGVEWSLGAIMFPLAGWKMEFGRFMLVLSAMLFSLAAAVWRASADD